VTEKPQWVLAEAIELCTLIQSVSPAFSAHPALTGGLLYKTGPRKDCDIVIYQRGDSNGERKPIDWGGLWEALEGVGLTLTEDFGYCKKCRWRGKVVDIFDPTNESEYPPQPAEIEEFRELRLLQ